MIFTVRKKNIDIHHSQGCLQQKNYVRIASWSSFVWIHFCIEQATKTKSQRETDGQWVITLGLMTYVGSTCLFTHICKKVTSLMLAAVILYTMYILYTQYILLPTHNTRASGIYPLIMGSPATIKVTLDPSQGQGVKWLVCLTPQIKKGLKEGYSCPAHWLGDRTEVPRSSGAGKWVCSYCLHPLHYSGTATSLSVHCSLLMHPRC